MRGVVLVVAVAAAAGCYEGRRGGVDDPTGGTSGDPDGSEGDGSETGEDADADVVPSGPTGLRLLTPTQYQNSVIDVLGPVAADAVGQWRSSIAAAQGGVSAAGVEDYEAAAFSVAGEVFGDPGRGSEVAGCDAAEAGCIERVIETLGRRAWRRPLTAGERDRYVALADSTAAQLGGDPWIGLEHAVAGLLQSPNFIYRVEIGDPDEDEPDHLRLDAFEIASRLSYLVWNTTPDDRLLDAAEAGDLDRPKGLGAQADRLLESPRAREGTVQVFVDMFDLDALLSLQKDSQLLPAFSPTVGPAMREELVEVIGNVVLDERDLRRLFDTRDAYVDAELAALYGIEGNFGSTPAAATLPDTRGGLLTYAGFLAVNSGEASTSPTKRGLTVRRVVMCEHVPPPPPDVEAELPEPGEGEYQTKRDQLEEHRNNAVCASCHELLDPIGLALEHFDALGGYRATDQGLPIDASGSLDGEDFADAVGMGAVLAAHPSVPDCTIRNLYRYAFGHVEQDDQEAIIEALLVALEDEGYDLTAVIRALVTSESFRVGVKP